MPAAGHVRTPSYCQGLVGDIVDVLGTYPNPEDLAYHGDGRPLLALYQVRFLLRDLWSDHAGSPSDSLLVDLYEHWLERPELTP